MEVNGENWNILVPPGKESKNDSQSSGERKGSSPNRIMCQARKRCMDGVVGYDSKSVSDDLGESKNKLLAE